MKPKNKEKSILSNTKYFRYSLRIALIGITCFLILTTIAILAYPNYNFFYQYLSELGIGKTAIIFNLGVILCGLLLIPFFISKYKPEEFLSQLICFLGTASVIFFIGVGVFPLTSKLLHTYFAGLFFFTIAIVIMLVLIQIIKKNILLKKIVIYYRLNFFLISLFTVIVIIDYLITQTPLLQKLAVLGIILWIIEWMIIISKDIKNSKNNVL